MRFYIIENGTLTSYTGEPALIEFAAHREILIVAGIAPVSVPHHDWASTGL